MDNFMKMKKMQKIKEKQQRLDNVDTGLTKKSDSEDFKNTFFISKTVEPNEIGQPKRMATFGEMLKFWDNFNEQLYKRIIFIRYHNA